MRGILAYNEEDYKKNSAYADWLISEFEKKNIQLKLIIREEYYKKRTYSGDCDFLINRTRDYNLSVLFELNHIRVFNNSTITLLGNNKLAAYLYAKEKKMAYADVYSRIQAQEQIIRKPIYGHGGEDIKMLDSDHEYSSKYLYQQFVGDAVGDIRFYVIGNRILHAILRTPKEGFISNFKQGGDIQVYEYSHAEELLIQEFIKDLQIDFTGIDFLLTKDGKLIFNEIEDVVGSRMLSKLKINDTTELFVEHVYQECRK